MPPPLDDLSGPSLLAVFAHPDDESLACGGLLARCAEYGARVSLLCLTHGEHGWHPDHIAVHERTTAVVAELRERRALIDAPVGYC